MSDIEGGLSEGVDEGLGVTGAAIAALEDAWGETGVDVVTGVSIEVRKAIWPVAQSTNGLWRDSQLYPRTAEDEGSRVVT